MADKREYRVTVFIDTWSYEFKKVGLKNAMHAARGATRYGIVDNGDRIMIYPGSRVRVVEVEAILPETPQEPLV